MRRYQHSTETVHTPGDWVPAATLCVSCGKPIQDVPLAIYWHRAIKHRMLDTCSFRCAHRLFEKMEKHLERAQTER